MTVVESEGMQQPFDADRLAALLNHHSLTSALPLSEIELVVANVNKSLPETVTVDQLLILTAEAVALRTILHPDCALLAGRIEACRIRRLVTSSFSDNFAKLRAYIHPRTKESHPLVAQDAAEFVAKHSRYLNSLIALDRDYELAYFGMCTLAKSYIIRMDDTIAETPQYMFLRVAIGIHCKSPDALDRVTETYELMSQKYFIHSSPTLFNAATDNNYLSLCFLMAMEEDSIDGIYKTLHKAALILKGSGGIGIHAHNIRANGSLIKSSNGTSSGLVPMLRVFNNTARYVDQGGNKRPGAIAVYLEPWHADIMEVLELRKNHGQEELRARDLFYALWIPDLFMERVRKDEDWPLFSPNEAPGLSDVYGEEFVELFEKYENEGRAMRTIRAQKLWMQILESQTETGMPFMLYKDSCNRKLNQKNLGTIKSSNLCCEIVEYSSPEEIAVCNLGLLALPTYVVKDEKSAYYDFAKLHRVAKVLARNLDTVIDATKYPVEVARVSNMKHRPIAIGVQGLADVFMELRLPFDSPEAKVLNSQIFETIYHAAVECSVEMAMEKGRYESFEGSPASKGQLQFDLWNQKARFFDDWDELKERVKMHGLRNSLLVAPMPTASTSQILGFNECFEPFTSNIYLRRVLSGEFQVVNKYLLQDLIDLGIWSLALKDKIITDNGLIQNVVSIPQKLKDLYKTVWEISQKVIVELAADRGAFIDQLQSMNIHLQNPTFGRLTSCHFYAWEKGLKTGMYYLRTQAAARAIQFTVDHEKMKELDTHELADTTKLEWKDYKEAKQFNKQETESPNNLKRFKTPESLPLSPFMSDNSDSSVPKKVSRLHVVTREIEKNDDDDYDIYDNTPLSCNISDPENCEACSG